MIRSTWAFVAGAIYAVFLLTAPFAHHDLACELKHPQHCTACMSSVLGADPNRSTIPSVSQLADAGSTTSEQTVVKDLLLAIRTTGRSPPTDA